MRGPSLIILRSPRLERLQALLVASGAAPAALQELQDADLPGSFPAQAGVAAGEAQGEIAADGTSAGDEEGPSGRGPAAWPSPYASSALVYDAAALSPAEARILGRARVCGALSQLIGIGEGAEPEPAEFRPDEQLPWPLDLAQLEALAARAWSPAGDLDPRPPLPADGGPADAGSPLGADSAEPTGSGLDDLRRIERILRGIEDRRQLHSDPELHREAQEAHRGRGRAETRGAGSLPASPRGRRLARSLRRSVGPFRRAQDALESAEHPPRAPFPGGARSNDRAPGSDPMPSLRAAAPPRTAFLRTRIQPARRTHGAAGAQDPAGALDGFGHPDGAPLDRAAADDSLMEERLLQAALEPGAPLLTREELDAFFGPDPELPADVDSGGHAPTTAAGTAPRPESALDGPELDELSLDGPGAPLPCGIDEPTARTAGAERPGWLKAQVADLADIVQTLDLRARTSHAHTQIGDELARLRQFTRTLGIVASPPPRGDRTFDLASFVEEQLGAAAGRSVDAPRLLFRRDGAPDAGVRADKMLLALALDALLQTAIACATSGDVVRVELLNTDAPDANTRADDATEPELCLRIDFPAGPLAGRGPDAVLRPYALRAELPTIGPNALPAAGAIAVGQGGDLRVEDLSGQRTAFVLTLPALTRRSVTEQG